MTANLPNLKSEKRISGHWLVLAGAVLWGTTGTSQALAPSGASSAVVGTLRLVVGGLALLAWSVWKGNLSAARTLPRKATFLAAMGVALYQLTFFAGVAQAGVAIGTIVAVGSAPIAAGIFGYFLHGESPGKIWFLSTTLAIFGNILLVSGQASGSTNLWGIALALGAGVSYAAYTSASKKAMEGNHSPDLVMAVVFTLGALMLLPILFGSNLAWIATPRGIIVILHLGVIATGVSYIFFARGLQRTPVSMTVTLSLAEPLTATLLGVFLLGESLTLQSSLGVLLIFVGLAILSLKQKPKHIGG